MGQLFEGEHAPPYYLGFELYGFVDDGQEDTFDGSALPVIDFQGVRTGFAARGKAVATTSASVPAPATVTEGGQTGSSVSSSPSAADNGARFEFRV